MGEQLRCCACNNTFEADREKKTCSRECSVAWQKHLHPRQTFSCQWCGQLYSPRNNNRDTYCSRKCYFGMKRFRGLIKRRITLTERQCFRLKRAKEKPPIAAVALPAPRTCRQCGTDIGKRVLLCRTCRYANDRKHKFSKHRDRARRYGVTYVEFNKNVVFERDGWTCRLCGVAVLKVWDVNDPTSAELDHIIPISKGGPHTIENTQCLCRSCNGLKHDRTQSAVVHLVQCNTLPGG